MKKTKHDNLTEIEKANEELENIKAKTERVVALAREHINNEEEKLRAKMEAFASERLDIEKKIAEKTDECKSLLAEIDALKARYERKEKEVVAIGENSNREKLILEKQILDKETQIEKHISEKKAIEHDFFYYKNTYEELAEKEKILAEQYAEKETEFKHIIGIHLEEIDRLKKETAKLLHELSEEKEKAENLKRSLDEKLAEMKDAVLTQPTESMEALQLSKENEQLRNDLAELQKKACKESQLREAMEDELRKFIKELKVN